MAIFAYKSGYRRAFDVVSLLLEYGVILNRRDDRGYTALMHATAMGDVKPLKY
jgi:ankyrin repeat protein